MTAKKAIDGGPGIDEIEIRLQEHLTRMRGSG